MFYCFLIGKRVVIVHALIKKTRQTPDKELKLALDAERGWLGAFRARLKALGWIEGQNLVIENAFADILAWRAHALAVAGTAATFRARERIAAFALSNRLSIATAGVALVEASRANSGTPPRPSA